ncbi:GerAB/ArcD/ProY family transporter [Lederbergia citrea]|uniref:GerAB/ArcD/ProY family transporter n=1 Tax=Lederbergia citrea TaxID=2833581 RepID=UPI001BC9742B|nr:GerAB/ArcD/ProY family transporter [Lederbergia citrea]MBS4178576.1 GerAB/ArcD/ProY family transporter [Lederbergia citrea]
MRNKKEITKFQLAFVIIQAQIGVGVISLPYEISRYAKGDSWISVLLAGLIVQGIIVLMWILMNRFPSRNFFEVLQILLGKFLGKIAALFYCIYFILLGSTALATYGYILQIWMLPLTPTWILLLLMALVGIYTVKEDLRIMARFFVLASVVLIVFLALSAFALKNANFTNILPVGSSGFSSIIQGIKPAFYSFLGFEILMIIFPFIQSSRGEILKAASIANLFVTLFYTFLVLISLLLFSQKEMKLTPDPIFYSIKSISFKIIERPDLLFTSMWIVLVATTFMNILYCASSGLTFVMNARETKKFVFVSATACFLISVIFKGKFEIASIAKIISQLGIIFVIIIPICLLLISLIFTKKRGADSQ